MSINPYSGVVYYYNDSEGEKKKKYQVQNIYRRKGEGNGGL